MPMPDSTERSHRIGARLAELRKQLGFTQREVSSRLGMSEGGYRHYEAGRARLALCDVAALAEALGIAGSYLLERLGVIESDSVRGVRRLGATVELPVTRRVALSTSDEHVWAIAATHSSALEPEVLPSDVLLIDLSDRAPNDDDLVAVRTAEGSIQIKRYRLQNLQPVLVGAKGTAEPADEMQVQGVVVALVRRYR